MRMGGMDFSRPGVRLAQAPMSHASRVGVRTPLPVPADSVMFEGRRAHETNLPRVYGRGPLPNDVIRQVVRSFLGIYNVPDTLMPEIVWEKGLGDYGAADADENLIALNPDVGASTTFGVLLHELTHAAKDYALAKIPREELVQRVIRTFCDLMEAGAFLHYVRMPEDPAPARSEKTPVLSKIQRQKLAELFGNVLQSAEFVDGEFMVEGDRRALRQSLREILRRPPSRNLQHQVLDYFEYYLFRALTHMNNYYAGEKLEMLRQSPELSRFKFPLKPGELDRLLRQNIMSLEREWVVMPEAGGAGRKQVHQEFPDMKGETYPAWLKIERQLDAGVPPDETFLAYFFDAEETEAKLNEELGFMTVARNILHEHKAKRIQVPEEVLAALEKAMDRSYNRMGSLVDGQEILENQPGPRGFKRMDTLFQDGDDCEDQPWKLRQRLAMVPLLPPGMQQAMIRKNESVLKGVGKKIAETKQRLTRVRSDFRRLWLKDTLSYFESLAEHLKDSLLLIKLAATPRIQKFCRAKLLNLKGRKPH